MGFEINIDSKQVEQQIVQAVIDASIGDKIKEEIKKAMNQRDGYDRESIVDKAIRETVRQKITQLVANEVQKHSEEIEKKIIPLITQEAIDKITTAAWEWVHDRIRRNL